MVEEGMPEKVLKVIEKTGNASILKDCNKLLCFFKDSIKDLSTKCRSRVFIAVVESIKLDKFEELEKSRFF